MKITVFGGSGFLGSHVCDKLSDAGHEVTNFDIIQSPWLRPDQQEIVGDILNIKELQSAVQGADIVFNFAGIADIGEANGRPVDTVRFNILGNTNILEACHLAGIKRYIFASSVYVYSKSGGFYRCSKQACESYIETYKQNYGLEYTILRYGSLYGPRADERNAIYRFVNQALTDGKISYMGSPTALREYIHVEDAAIASVEILKPDYANKYIIFTGNQQIQVGKVIRMIGEMLGHSIDIEIVDDLNNSHYEITPYNFTPRMGKKYVAPLHTDLGQGILQIIELLHKQRHPELHNIEGIFISEEK